MPIDLLQIAPHPAWDEEPLARSLRLHRWWELVHRDAFLSAHGPAIRAVATGGGTGLPRAVMDALPALEAISVHGVGVDAVDLPDARRRGIAVGNTPDVLTGDVADLAVGMILTLERGIVGADAWVRSGDWAARGLWPLQRRVHGRRAGVLGLGRIGAAIARRLAAFDMEIAYSARAPKDVPWDYEPEPVAHAVRPDVPVVALAATPETRAVVGPAVIAALGSDGSVVNVSRAANVDEGALLNAVEGGRLRGAALDLFEGEPGLDPRWARLPNVLLQPHAASGAVETRRAMGQLMRDNLAAYFEGWPMPARVA